MVSLLQALLFPALAGGPSSWVVDGTSLGVHYGREPVADSVRCPIPEADAPKLRGQPLTTLGVAVVAYSKKQGTMTWGHASLRAVYCLDRTPTDVEYEVYRLSAWNEGILRQEHAGEAFAEGPWLSTQRGAQVLFRNAAPVDGGWFGDQQAQNREIYVSWLRLEPSERNRIVLEIEARWEAQREGLRAYADLPTRFRWIQDNCTSLFHVLPERLGVGRPITPFAWTRRLAPHTVLPVLHPSHHLVRRWGGRLPSRTGRHRPVFRRNRTLPRRVLPALRSSLAAATPALPWLEAGLGLASTRVAPTHSVDPGAHDGR